MENQSIPIQSGDKSALAAAMSKAQIEFKVAAFDKKANYGPYASFTSIRQASIESLSKNGLAIFQPVHFDGTNYFLETIVVHSSGQCISSSVKLLIDRNNMQGLGSAITYARRYTWASIIGVVSDDDDDGNAASKPSAPEKIKNHASELDELDKHLADDKSGLSPLLKQLTDLVSIKNIPYSDMPEIIKKSIGVVKMSKDLNDAELATVITFIRMK